MNLTNTAERTGYGIELKYCERCGGLFLRPAGSSLVWCGGCQARQKALASKAMALGPTVTRRTRRGPDSRGCSIAPGQIDNLRGVAAIEVLPC